MVQVLFGWKDKRRSDPLFYPCIHQTHIYFTQSYLYMHMYITKQASSVIYGLSAVTLLVTNIFHYCICKKFGLRMNSILGKQANSENRGPPRGNKFDLKRSKGKFDFEKVKGQDQGHGILPMERACHKDHACQISMLYR